ncbi:glycine cleavage system H protein [Streptomyces violascens]|nr:glycine cleavage system H protein [Streptomyces violascens]
MRSEGSGVAVVGLTAFAVDQLGDVTLVAIDCRVGDKISAGRAFGTVESAKTLSDVLTPVSGEVVAVHSELEQSPESVNHDNYGEGWLIKVKVSDPGEVGRLMDADTYAALLETAAH